MGEVLVGRWGKKEVKQENRPMEYLAASVRLAATAWHLAGRHDFGERLDAAYKASGYSTWVLLSGELQEIVEAADLGKASGVSR